MPFYRPYAMRHIPPNPSGYTHGIVTITLVFIVVVALLAIGALALYVASTII